MKNKRDTTKKTKTKTKSMKLYNISIWKSRADKKCREIRMVKVNVIFNGIRLLISLTPLQVIWVMVIN
jgi:hypothetical protein